MKRPQYVFRPNLSDPQHRRAWALLQQVPSARRKEFLVQAILATEQTDSKAYLHNGRVPCMRRETAALHQYHGLLASNDRYIPLQKYV